MKKPVSIPRPLVRVNQWTILLSVLIAWTTQISWVLLIPLIANLGGLLFNFNPIMKAARPLLKKPMSSYIPEDVTQQKFNSTIAITCLAVAYVSWIAGNFLVASIFMSAVALASFVAILGFCIGCFLFFQINQFKYKLKRRSA